MLDVSIHLKKNALPWSPVESSTVSKGFFRIFSSRIKYIKIRG